ncbi:MAG TPA: hypothetical protein VMB52_01360 [Verrucomicrobiae bacterium]|nr:hypothetical protein [Verrucomicrobiae bacterium]
MLIFTHVAIALLGLVQATYGLVSPSHAKMRITYAFTGATIASGTYLAWSLHSSIVQSCESGLAYLTLIVAATLATRYRLARMQQQHDE